MIEILKASAGSGKTWNLARYYIRLMLEKDDPFSYRHILAVTFTNKATDEMKDRILKELHKLSVEPLNSDYYGDFVPSLYPDAASLAKASGTLLCNILHDYSAFAVSTIDRFFQQTLRAFAREIGQFSSYAVELDRASVIKESVDRLLDSLTESQEHSRSLEWMTRKTLSQLEEGEGYKLDFTLKKIADRFNSEEYRIALEKAGLEESGLYSDERLDALEQGCGKICEDFPAMVSEAAAMVLARFDEAGLKPEDTYSSFMLKNVGKFTVLKADKPVPLPTDAFRNRAMDVSAWYPKAKKHLEGLVTSGLIEAVEDFFALFGTEYKVYNTALQLRRQVYGFAVANDLYANFKALLKEKNILTIDQTNSILRDIIDGSDTPFVYEKIGVRYDHFLLDEFQDTSSVQWDNFRPLLDNSVASGSANLIVGDVKQSIYRWRQSDWELLENQVQKDFEGYVDVRPLDTNFRSAREIVDFNNDYFTAAAGYLDGRLGGDQKVIQGIYSDVVQKSRKSYGGMVEVAFCQQDTLHEQILERIREAVDAGFRLGDITILVRLNKEGAEIADYLVENSIPVVSDDSLKVSSSLTVRRLVSLLSGMENPQDSMSRHLASSLGIDVPSSWHSLVDLCEELLRRLAEVDRDLFDSETLYIQSFMDILLDYVSSDGDSLRGFLKKWADDKSNISSPKSDDAVQIMTVHKSKGLDFPYVIFPSMSSVGFYSFDNRWSRPDVQGTALEEIADGVYDVCLSGKSVDTLFENRYREEMLMQYIDNINVMYVALTRASKAMSIISEVPQGADLADPDGSDPQSFSGFDQWTLSYMASTYAEQNFTMTEAQEGTLLCFRRGELAPPEHEEVSSAELMPSVFHSWPLNSENVDGQEDVRERGRLKFSTEALDFFSSEGSTGVSASNRIRGVVLHDVLSRVFVPEDLDSAVRTSVLSGDLAEDEAEQVRVLLAGRISEVAGMGWFPQDRGSVMNEVELIDSDGSIFRPDRVIKTGESVIVVDYKFGEHDNRYLRQVRKYADIWKRMGYWNVSAFLWYVQTGDIVQA